MMKYLLILYFLPFLAGNAHAADCTIAITDYLKDNASSVAMDSRDFTVNVMSHSAKQLYSEGAFQDSIQTVIYVTYTYT